MWYNKNTMWIYNNKFFVPKGTLAIVLYPFVFTRLSKEEVTESLRKHEEKHLEQARRGLVIGFYVAYLWEYLKLRMLGLDHYKAYYYNPFEVEAREAEIK